MRHLPCRFAFLLAAALHAMGSSAWSQTDGVEVQTRADRHSIRLGDPAVLTVTVTLPDASSLDANAIWSDTIPHIEWLSPLKADTVPLAGGRRISLTRGFTSFDSGSWVIPPPSLVIDGRRVSGDTTGIEVGTVPLTGDDYRDIGDILEAEEGPAGSGWPLHAILAGLLLSAASWWLYRARRRKKARPAAFPASPREAFSKAMSGLEALIGKGLAGDSDVRELHTSLYAILRCYLHEAHGWRVSSLTTGDLLALLASHCPDRDELARVAGVLRLSDAVRFARHLPSRDESLRSVGDLRSFIRFLHETVRPA